MATMRLAFNNGAALDLDYTNNRATALVCVNPTSRPFYGATWSNTGQLYSATFPAGQTTTIAIPNNAGVQVLATADDLIPPNFQFMQL